jgi:hypothetical protein
MPDLHRRARGEVAAVAERSLTNARPAELPEPCLAEGNGLERLASRKNDGLQPSALEFMP